MYSLRISFSLTTDGAVVFAHTTISWPGNASAPTNSSRESGMRAAMLSSFLAGQQLRELLRGRGGLGFLRGGAYSEDSSEGEDQDDRLRE